MTTQSIRKNRSKSKLQQSDRHVLVVSKSNANTSAQIVDPKTGKTLGGVSTSTIDKKGTKTELATIAGVSLADMCKSKKISTLVVNRNGYRYHGRIKALVEAVRAGGVTI